MGDSGRSVICLEGLRGIEVSTPEPGDSDEVEAELGGVGAGKERVLSKRTCNCGSVNIFFNESCHLYFMIYHAVRRNGRYLSCNEGRTCLSAV